jgi:hypothetical protein
VQNELLKSSLKEKSALLKIRQKNGSKKRRNMRILLPIHTEQQNAEL